MKKLLLVSIVALGFVHQMSPMAFKRNEKRQFVPGIRAGELRYREKRKKILVQNQWFL